MAWILLCILGLVGIFALGYLFRYLRANKRVRAWFHQWKQAITGFSIATMVRAPGVEGSDVDTSASHEAVPTNASQPSTSALFLLRRWVLQLDLLLVLFIAWWLVVHKGAGRALWRWILLLEVAMIAAIVQAFGLLQPVSASSINLRDAAAVNEDDESYKAWATFAVGVSVSFAFGFCAVALGCVIWAVWTSQDTRGNRPPMWRRVVICTFLGMAIGACSILFTLIPGPETSSINPRDSAELIEDTNFIDRFAGFMTGLFVLAYYSLPIAAAGILIWKTWHYRDTQGNRPHMWQRILKCLTTMIGLGAVLFFMSLISKASASGINMSDSAEHTTSANANGYVTSMLTWFWNHLFYTLSIVAAGYTVSKIWTMRDAQGNRPPVWHRLSICAIGVIAFVSVLGATSLITRAGASASGINLDEREDTITDSETYANTSDDLARDRWWTSIFWKAVFATVGLFLFRMILTLHHYGNLSHFWQVYRFAIYGFLAACAATMLEHTLGCQLPYPLDRARFGQGRQGDFGFLMFWAAWAYVFGWIGRRLGFWA